MTTASAPIAARLKVLVTGVSGFTGRYLAVALHEAGYEVHGLVASSPSMSIPGVERIHVGNLSDAAGLLALLRDVQPVKVAHLAAIAFVAHGDVAAMYQTNVTGTRNLLEAIVQSKAPVDSVLLISSANVYGNSIGGMLDESTPAAPASDYAVSKLAMEYVARLYGERLPLVVVRPFNYTGRGQAGIFLIPKIVDHVRRRADIIELGNLNVARDFSDVRTVVQYYVRILATPAAIGRTFNVCSGPAYTLQQVLEMATVVSGHSFEVRVNPAFVRANEVAILQGDRQQLVATVGELPVIALQDTVRWMIEAPA